MTAKKFASLCLIFIFNLSLNLMAATWQPPKNIGKTNGNVPCVAMDAEGNCIALWSYSDGVHSCIKASKKPFGGDWSTPVSLSSNDEQANSPALVIDKNGNATAVWKLTYGTEWNSPSLIEAATLERGSDDWIHIAGPLLYLEAVYNPPQLAVDDEGNVMAIWLSDGCIKGSRLFPGWSSWFALADFGKNEVDLDAPDFALDADGNALMLFESRHENGWIVIKATTIMHNALGPWSDPVQLSVADHWASTPTVKADSQGNAVAVWLCQNPGLYVEAARYQDKKWTAAPLSKNTSTYSNLAVTSSGKAYLLWNDLQGADLNVMCSTLEQGSVNWSTVNLTPRGEKLDCCSSLGLDSAGNAVVIFPNKMRGSLQAITLPYTSQKWSDPVNIAPYHLAKFEELYPEIVLAPNDSGTIIYANEKQVTVISETKLFTPSKEKGKKVKPVKR